MIFTTEEKNLMCIYNTSKRTYLIDDLEECLSYLYDYELIDIVNGIIAKLMQITDVEFMAIELDENFIFDDGEGQFE